MPLGGLKWEKELEGEIGEDGGKESSSIKPEIQVLGIDDAPFVEGDSRVKIVGALMRGPELLEKVFHSDVKRDGLDATGKIIEMIRESGCENIRAILLDGITFGGFNIADINRIYEETGIPVIATMTKRPRMGSISNALRNLGEADLRKRLIKKAGPVMEVGLGGRRVYMQVAGIGKKKAEAIIRRFTINGLVPEPVRVAHLIGRGAYMEPKREWPHTTAYKYVKKKHADMKRLKHRYLPGVAGELFDLILAIAIAWIFIQMLGWVLNTSSPLIIVESESMVHAGNWEEWYSTHDIDPNKLSFPGGIGIGDVVLLKGDNPHDIGIGDVIVYTRYNPQSIGGEPVIHRVIGIAEINGSRVYTYGLLRYEGGKIVTPCSPQSAYSIEEIRNLYSTEAIKRFRPEIGKDLDDFRVFITKGDNNKIEDQCREVQMISYPIHEDLVVGRAKLDIPYVGYVKLGMVCLLNYVEGNACGCRCWWPATHPQCCKTG